MKLIKFLLKLKAPRIVYVSCNPATCARDLDYLCHDVVCMFTNKLVLSFKLSTVITLEILSTDRTKYQRMLQTQKPTASRHVPSHSAYRMCLPAGTVLTFSCSHHFLTIQA